MGLFVKSDLKAVEISNMKELILLAILATCQVCTSYRESKEHQLLRELLGNYPNSEARPVHDNTDAVDLEVGYTFLNVFHFDADDAVVSMHGWLYEAWTDEFLRWNRTQYDVERIHLVEGHTWHPDVRSYKAVKETVGEKTKAVSFPSGLTIHIFPTTHRVQCERSGSGFDCKLIFGPWSYHSRQVSMRLRTSPGGLEMDYFKQHPTWKVSNQSARLKESTYDCCPDEIYQSLEITFNLTTDIIPV